MRWARQASRCASAKDTDVTYVNARSLREQVRDRPLGVGDRVTPWVGTCDVAVWSGRRVRSRGYRRSVVLPLHSVTVLLRLRTM